MSCSLEFNLHIGLSWFSGRTCTQWLCMGPEMVSSYLWDPCGCCSGCSATGLAAADEKLAGLVDYGCCSGCSATGGLKCDSSPRPCSTDYVRSCVPCRRDTVHDSAPKVKRQASECRRLAARKKQRFSCTSYLQLARAWRFKSMAIYVFRL